MSRDTVGVVIAAMNSAAFIDQALGSLAMQTTHADQVVVVDDHSDDDTVRLVERWRAILPLTLLRNRGPRRLGVWGARRAAIEVLETDLVLQLDGDDLVLPHHVAAMSETYAASPGLISPRPLTWTGQGPFRPATYTKGGLPLPGDQLVQLLAQNYVVVGSLYARELYERIGGYRQVAYGEEWDLWLRLVAAGARVSKPDEPSYVYRVRASSYAGGFARNEAETEVLNRFLGGSDHPVHRRAAKVALLQRTGIAALGPLAPVDGPLPEPVRAFAAGHDPALTRAHHDPDLGWVLSFDSGGEVVVTDDAARVIVHVVEKDGNYEAVEIADPLMRRDASSLRDILRGEI
ncbi:glycosyltransferase family A protein [Streptomyces sp. NPDC005970]|uniref:glycosyltransferase family A protein n=1 Tax=Streptomyces sp. NPDC005970 TaxID=3156723 RepID=UPI0033C57765